MADPFVGEIRIVPFNFAPTGWAQCNGQLLPISQNTALFSLLGTQFGGNGTSNFALPNMQGNIPMDFGNGVGLTPRSMGEVGGTPAVTVSLQQLGPHSHPLVGTTAVAAVLSPANNVVFGEPPGSARNPTKFYETGTVTTPIQLDTSVIGFTGGNQPHNNMQPYLVLNFVISLQGVFPQRS